MTSGRGMRLENKVAIVTGGARGIGLAIAKRYVAEGARVVIADVDKAAGEAAARALGDTCRFVATDVGDARQAEAVVAESCRAFGDLDILVNNAGIIHGAEFLDLAEADFDRVLRVNLKGAFLVGQAAARRMVAQVAAGKPPGTIINMSSINAVVAIPNHTPYCVSKGGVDQLTKVMALCAGAARHPGQRHRPRLDHDRHPQGGRHRPRGEAADHGAHAARPHRRARRDRVDRRLPRVAGSELYHGPDHLCRRRPARAELYGAGQGRSARVRLEIFMAAKRSPALDRIDVKILAALQRDGRSTIQKLAAAIGLSPRASLERVRRLEASGVIAGYQAVIELNRLARPVNIFAEINLEKHANSARFEKRIAALDDVVECWEVSGTVDYLARFVCADLAAYEELTGALIDDANLGVARIVSHVALRPVRRFAGYPETLLGGKQK